MLERGASLRFFALFSASHTFVERKQIRLQLEGVCPEGEGVIITSALLHMLTFNRVGISKPSKTPANTHTYTHIHLTLTSLGHWITHTHMHTLHSLGYHSVQRVAKYWHPLFACGQGKQ